MREIKSAHAAAGIHGETFGEFDAGMLLGVEQVPENRLLRVIGTGGITGSRPDAAIFLVYQICGRQFFQFAKTPFVADAFVEIFGERFGETIRDGWIASRCGWTPYDGKSVTGWPIGTFVRGRRVMWEGELTTPSTGEAVRFQQAL